MRALIAGLAGATLACGLSVVHAQSNGYELNQPYSDAHLVASNGRVVRQQDSVRGSYFSQRREVMGVGEALTRLVPESSGYEVVIDERLASKAVMSPRAIEGNWKANTLEWAADNQLHAALDTTGKVLAVGYDHAGAEELIENEQMRRDLARIAFSEMERQKAIDAMNSEEFAEEGAGNPEVTNGEDLLKQFAEEWITVDLSDVLVVAALQNVLPPEWQVDAQVQEHGLLDQVVTIQGSETRGYFIEEIGRAAGLTAVARPELLKIIVREGN